MFCALLLIFVAFPRTGCRVDHDSGSTNLTRAWAFVVGTWEEEGETPSTILNLVTQRCRLAWWCATAPTSAQEERTLHLYLSDFSESVSDMCGVYHHSVSEWHPQKAKGVVEFSPPFVIRSPVWFSRWVFVKSGLQAAAAAAALHSLQPTAPFLYMV
jgi:hypothetical protein